MKLTFFDFKIGEVVNWNGKFCHVDGFATGINDTVIVVKCPIPMAINTFRGYEYRLFHITHFRKINGQLFLEFKKTEEI